MEKLTRIKFSVMGFNSNYALSNSLYIQNHHIRLGYHQAVSKGHNEFILNDTHWMEARLINQLHKQFIF